MKVKEMYKSIKRDYWNISQSKSQDTGYLFLFTEYNRQTRDERAAKLKKKLDRKCPFEFQVNTSWYNISVYLTPKRRPHIKFNDRKAYKRYLKYHSKGMEVIPL